MVWLSHNDLTHTSYVHVYGAMCINSKKNIRKIHILLSGFRNDIYIWMHLCTSAVHVPFVDNLYYFPACSNDGVPGCS